MMKSQQRLISDHHKVYTEEICKITPRNDDNKVLQAFDKTKTFSYGINAFKVCESEMLRVFKTKAKLRMLSKECESEMCMKEKKKCEMFLNGKFESM